MIRSLVGVSIKLLESKEKGQEQEEDQFPIANVIIRIISLYPFHKSLQIRSFLLLCLSRLCTSLIFRSSSMSPTRLFLSSQLSLWKRIGWEWMWNVRMQISVQSDQLIFNSSSVQPIFQDFSCPDGSYCTPHPVDCLGATCPPIPRCILNPCPIGIPAVDSRYSSHCLQWDPNPSSDLSVLSIVPLLLIVHVPPFPRTAEYSDPQEEAIAVQLQVRMTSSFTSISPFSSEAQPHSGSCPHLSSPSLLYNSLPLSSCDRQCQFDDQCASGLLLFFSLKLTIMQVRNVVRWDAVWSVFLLLLKEELRVKWTVSHHYTSSLWQW